MDFKSKIRKFKFFNNDLFNPKDEYGTNRKLIVIENYFAGVTNSFINGNYLTGLLINLHFSDAMMGSVGILTSIGNLFQVFAPAFLERFTKRKNILVNSRILIYLINIVFIGIIPFLKIDISTKAYLMFILIGLASLIGSITGPGLSVWHLKSIPQKIRNDYFTFFIITDNIVIFLAVLFAGKLTDIFKSSGNELLGLTILRVLAVVTSIIDLCLLSKIVEYPNIKSSVKINLKNMILTPFRDKRYKVTILVSCLWTFSANITGPYFNVYLLKDLKVSYSTMAMVNMLFLVTLVFFTPIWSRRIKGTSIFKTFGFLMSLYLIHYLGLAFTTSKTLILYPIFAFYSYVFNSGMALISAQLPYYNLPEENQTNYLGFYATVNTIFAILGMELGVQFIKYTESVNINLLNLNISNKQLIMIFSALVMLCVAKVVSHIGDIEEL